jgi:hypothetical protein
LIVGLQDMYRRLLAAQLWPGDPLPEVNGHPRTHSILAELGLLRNKQGTSGDVELFEDDCRKMRQRVLPQDTPQDTAVTADSGSFNINVDLGSSSVASPSHIPPFSANASLSDDNEVSLGKSSAPPEIHACASEMTKPLLSIEPSALDESVWNMDVLFLSDYTELDSSGCMPETTRPQFALQAQSLHESIQSMVGDRMCASEMSTAYDASIMGFCQSPSHVQLCTMDDMSGWNDDILELGFGSIVEVST